MTLMGWVFLSFFVLNIVVKVYGWPSYVDALRPRLAAGLVTSLQVITCKGTKRWGPACLAGDCLG